MAKIILTVWFAVATSVAGIQSYNEWGHTHRIVAGEPDIWGPSPAVVHRTYLAAKAASPQPVTIVFWDCSQARRYRGSLDYLTGDTYPYTWFRPGQYWSWPDAVRSCVRAAKWLHLAPPTMIVQAIGAARNAPGNPYWWRCPTVSQFLGMVRTAYVLGAGNVIAFTDPTLPCPALARIVR